MPSARERFLLPTAIAAATIALVLVGLVVLLGPEAFRTSKRDPVSVPRGDVAPEDGSKGIHLAPRSTVAAARDVIGADQTGTAAAPSRLRFAADAVYGRVVDGDGGPIEAAIVELFRGKHDCGKSTPIATATSDAHGCFRCERVDARRHFAATVDVDGFVPRIAFLRNGILNEVVLERAAVLEGRVLDAESGEAVMHASISYRILGHDNSPPRRSTADAAGRFRLADLAIGATVPLLVGRPDGLPYMIQVHMAEPRVERDLLLPPAVPTRVRVVDAESGLPIEGADVRGGWEDEFVGVSGADGTVAFADVGPPGEAIDTVSVRAVGHVALRFSIRDARTLSSDRDAVDLALPPGAAIDGIVVRADGSPVAGAETGAWVSPTVESVMDGLERERWTLAIPPSSRFCDVPRRSVTGSDGRFTIDGLLPVAGTWTVYACEPDGPIAAEARVDLSRSTQRLLVRLPLTDAWGTIEGIVTVNGRRCAHSVVLSGEEAFDFTSSNDRGEYRFTGVRPGEVTVALGNLGTRLGPHRENPTQRTVVVEPTRTTRCDLELNGREGTIEGRVLTPDGSSYAGAEVTARRGDGNGSVLAAPIVRSGAVGTFSLSLFAEADDPSVRWRVEARDGPSETALDDVALGARGIEVVLPRPVPIDLYVRDAGSGAVIDKVLVRWRRPGSSTSSLEIVRRGGIEDLDGTMVAEPNGRYRFRVPEGLIELVVSAIDEGYLPEALELAVAAGSQPPRVEVALERGCTVAIEPAGGPVFQDALVLLLREDEVPPVGHLPGVDTVNGVGLRIDPPLDHDEVFRRFVHLGSDEVIRIQGLRPGRYRLVSIPDVLELEPPVLVLPQETAAPARVTWRLRE